MPVLKSHQFSARMQRSCHTAKNLIDLNKPSGRGPLPSNMLLIMKSSPYAVELCGLLEQHLHKGATYAV